MTDGTAAGPAPEPGASAPTGSGAAPPAAAAGRRSSRPPRSRRRWIAGGLGFLVLVVVGLGVWMGLTALSARQHLETARTAAEATRTAVVAGDAAQAAAAVSQAEEAASAARSDTSSLPWRLASPLPVVGPTVRAVRQIAEAVDDLAGGVLAPAARAATVLNPASLRPAGGRLNIAALHQAAPELTRASRAAAGLQERVRDIPNARVGAVEQARTQLTAQTDELTALLSRVSTAADLLPSMLGGDSPRSYFVAFQTNAEARGTGGLVGAFGILRATGGAVSLDERAANTGLADDPAGAVDLGGVYAALYPGTSPTGRWINSNFSPHFPYAGRIWTALWDEQSGQHLDGAIATDPVALSYVLGATGPITLPGGETVTADNVVALTESEVYARFDNNDARKAFLQEISSAVVTQVLLADGSTTALLSALGRAVDEGHIAVYSTHPEEQAKLAGTALGHQVPDDDAPYAAVVVNNASQGKLDYYLGRRISYAAGPCDDATRTSTVSATLTNHAPAAGLPAYVTIQAGSKSPGPPGTNASLVSLYATRGAQLEGVAVDGRPAGARVGSERGHPVFSLEVSLAPGATSTVTWTLREPTVAGAARVPVQPLVAAATVTDSVPRCRP